MKCCNYIMIMLFCMFLIALSSCRTHQSYNIDEVKRANIFATDSFHFIIRPLLIHGKPNHGAQGNESTTKGNDYCRNQQRSFPIFEVRGSNKHSESITQHENKKTIPLESPLVSTTKNFSYVKILLILFALFFLVLLFKVIRL